MKFSKKFQFTIYFIYFVYCIEFIYIYVCYIEFITAASKISHKISDKPITVKPFISDLAFQWRLATQFGSLYHQKRK